MVKVGDRVKRWPKTIESVMDRQTNSFGTALKIRPLMGVVVYVHPKKRFHVVEFENDRGMKLRETFDGVG